jgi:hypothetical protein
LRNTAAQTTTWPDTTGARQALFLPWLLTLLVAFALICCATPASHAAAPAGVQWGSLSPIQQQALGPLSGSWNTLTPDRQQKWLAFAGKYQKMSPADQQRAQQKMDTWIKLTPEQRLAARENYIRSNKLQPDQRAQKWQEYQQLSDEQKAQLASRAKKPLITNLPTPAESKETKLQPLKTPKKTGVAAPAAAARPLAPAVIPAPTSPATVDPANSTH